MSNKDGRPGGPRRSAARLREWAQRARGTLRYGRSDDDLEEELRSHLELAGDDASRRGNAAEAARTARIRAGGVTQGLEALRDQRSLPRADDLARDLRYALRTLRRSPAFTTIALATLALGIGANTAVYQIIDAVRLRPLPVERAQELMIVELADLSNWSGRRTTTHPVLSHPVWQAFKEHQQTFSAVLAWSNATFHYGEPGDGRPALGLFVSGEFFEVLGVRPWLGRVFTAADDQIGCGVPGAVVSHGFWERQLGGSRAAIGQLLTINGRTVEVIGVTPPRFTGLEVGHSFDIAVPVCSHETLGAESGWLDDATIWWLTVMGRREPQRPTASVNPELGAVSPHVFTSSLPAGYPAADVDDYLRLRLRAQPGTTGVSSLRNRYSDPLIILFGLTGVVLLMASTNLANLILARCAAREREFAVRLAVGASRGRLVTQVMIENGLLAIGGAAAGLGLSAIFSRSLVAFFGAELALALPLDARVIAFVIAMAFLTCVSFGLFPVWRASRISAFDVMKASGRTVSSDRETVGLRQILVVSQIAVSVVLLFAGFLFATTLRNLITVETGFDPDNVVVARIDLSRMRLQPQGRFQVVGEILQRLRGIPGVIAAEARHVPMNGTGSSMTVRREGADPAANAMVRLNVVSEDYLRTMGIELIAGRDFGRQDAAGASRVAIVNHAFVRRLEMTGNPVGQRFEDDGSQAGDGRFEIVGLVADTKYLALREDVLPIAFVPTAQIEEPRRVAHILIRSPGGTRSLSEDIRRAAAAVNPAITTDLRPLVSIIHAGLQRERLMAVLSGFAGILATLVAAVGLYGVMSYLVVRRTNEIGIRLALGANRATILGMILRQVGVLVAVGLGSGAAVALVLSGYTQSLLFGLASHDGRALGLACALLASVATAAAVLPARRAARLDPSAALRQE